MTKKLVEAERRAAGKVISALCLLGVNEVAEQMHVLITTMGVLISDESIIDEKRRQEGLLLAGQHLDEVSHRHCKHRKQRSQTT